MIPLKRISGTRVYVQSMKEGQSPALAVRKMQLRVDVQGKEALIEATLEDLLWIADCWTTLPVVEYRDNSA